MKKSTNLLKKDGSLNIIFIVLIFLLVVLLGIFVYFLTFKQSSNNNQTGPITDQTNEQEDTNITDENQQDNKEETKVEIDDEQLVIFHNGTGPMCIEALNFFEQNSIEYVEYLTTDEDFNEKLEEYIGKYGNESEGVSTSFGYYPMIFYKDKAFSGFNNDIGQTLLSL
jgi:glutaredoxin